MIIANTIIKQLRNINYQFLENNKNGLKVNGKSYILKTGSLPIVLVASHAVKQYRESQTKLSDYLTGPLAIYLAERCNCSYFVRVFNDKDDPNYPLGVTLSEIKNEYLKALKEYILMEKPFLLVDIHGCMDTKQYDCSIWSDEGNPCNPTVVQIFENNLISRDFSFDRGSEYLGGQITRQCSSLTNTFQMEIKRKIRSLKIEQWVLLKNFIEAMEISIYETSDYFLELEKVKERKMN